MPRSLVLLIVSILAACTAATHRSDLRPGDSGVSVDPLVGTWTFSGNVSNYVAITWTFGADKTFSLVENTAPLTTPAPPRDAAAADEDCKVTHTISGTYRESISDGVKSLTWAMSTGRANAVVGCSDPANNWDGTVMTDEGIDARIHEGSMPPRIVKYSVTSSMLVLNPTATGGGGLSFRTEFQKKSD